MKIVNIDMELSSTEMGADSRYLILESVPNLKWINMFRHIHNNLKDPAKRTIDISGKNIIVICPMDEIQYQIDTLNSLCRQTDDQIIAAHEESLRREKERVRLIEEKKQAAREEFGKLKF